jgi:uncharacterized membrane protein YdbT with pleckstrin-like domain
MKRQNLIWRDRKRFMGMPITFTRYGLSKSRLFLSVGLLSVQDDEILLYRVRDLTVKRSLWQRLFGVGTITVKSSDKTTPTLLLKNVKDPMSVKELIHQHVEEAKNKRRVRIGEVMTEDFDENPDDIDA